MLTELEEKLDGLEWEQARVAAAEYVGLPGPLPAPALRRAMVEDRYCLVLLAFRGNLPRLKELVTHPDNRAYELPEDSAPAATTANRSTAGLVIEAGKALNRWAGAGFRTVDQETYERRTAACAGCPELIEPPVRWVYKVALATAGDDRVCGACGCVASRKARLATERCPRRDPARPELSRWDEPFAD
ncbi:hypothetical protein [Nonomuraea jiangxiensis]|uniref:Uncharacterized protein n=1 Tax=Nonomuraea jiangxiensis TaxID=633440 RepID=A0A1G9PUS5_9ACTN|nr:hypothetical protein [Nonomuraea jiangxiensis]SDM01855.1 hypothetical protein SAMN05421869_13490 [Nonomuraea jiangxiensis]